MPSPYMTLTWLFITLVLVVLALMGACFVKFFVKDTMFENRKKEQEEWKSFLEDVKKKEIERLAKLNLQKKLSRANTKNSRKNSRNFSNGSLEEDYARAPEDEGNSDDQIKPRAGIKNQPKKSRFAATHQEEGNLSQRSSQNDKDEWNTSRNPSRTLKTISKEEQQKEFSKIPSTGSKDRPQKRKIVFQGQDDDDGSSSSKKDDESSKLLKNRVFWPEKKRKAIDPSGDNSYLEIIN